MAALLDVRFAKGGLIDGARIEALLAERGVTGPIERCSIPFAAVAADIESGAEVILRKGPIERAVRASIGLPGIFAPIEMDGQWLMDGGLVNPLPVSTCRSLGANVVIAVDVNSSRLWRGHTAAKPSILARRRGGRPTSIDALAKAVTILQVQLTLARLASEPAEHVLVPDLNDVGPFQFERAREAIAEGRACVQRSAQALRALVA